MFVKKSWGRFPPPKLKTYCYGNLPQGVGVFIFISGAASFKNRFAFLGAVHAPPPRPLGSRVSFAGILRGSRFSDFRDFCIFLEFSVGGPIFFHFFLPPGFSFFGGQVLICGDLFGAGPIENKEPATEKDPRKLKPDLRNWTSPFSFQNASRAADSDEVQKTRSPQDPRKAYAGPQ